LKDSENYAEKRGSKCPPRSRGWWRSLQIKGAVKVKRHYIPEKELRLLYMKGLKIDSICKHFKCSRTPIWNRFREFGIIPNRCAKRLSVSKEMLENLYWEKNIQAGKSEWFWDAIKIQF
jgi:hypothetical protein